MKRRSRIIIIIFLVLIFIPILGDVIVPIIYPDVLPGVGDLEVYIVKHGHLPPSESAYSQWLEQNLVGPPDRRIILPPFNILYGVPTSDLEIRRGRLVYKKDGEKCRLIYGGKELSYDIFMGWKYNRASRRIFKLLQETPKSAVIENNASESNQNSDLN